MIVLSELVDLYLVPSWGGGGINGNRAWLKDYCTSLMEKKVK